MAAACRPNQLFRAAATQPLCVCVLLAGAAFDFGAYMRQSMEEVNLSM